MKKNAGKAPAIQFYYKDWLSDHKLKRSSKRAKGVWIDLIAISCDLNEKGVFRDELGSFDRNEMLDLLTGNRRESAAGFDELVKRQIIKQRDDGTFYVKRVYEDAKLSAIRKEAGKKGGNPSLVKGEVGNLVNQNNNQNPTPSSSTPIPSSFSNNNIKNHIHTTTVNNSNGCPVDMEDLKSLLQNLDMDLANKMGKARAELERLLSNKFKPVNGTRQVMADIVLLVTYHAVKQKTVKPFNDVMQWARDVFTVTNVKNPTGLFVQKCKDKLGYQPRGMILDKP